MTLEDLNEAIRILNKKHKIQIMELEKAYIMKNLSFNVGDIITNGGTIIKVESFSVSYHHSTGEPIPSYIGEALTKKLKPFATPKRATVSGAFCKTITLIK